MAKRVLRATTVPFFRQNELTRARLVQEIARTKDVREIPEGMDADAIYDYLKSLKMPKRGPMKAGDLPPLRIPTNALATSFKAELLDGIHAAADVYKIALYVAASTIGAGTTAYTATNEVVGTGYTAGGQNLAGRQIVLDGTTQILDWTTDPVWAASTITARGAMIYNSTKANRALIILDFGADITSTNGNFTVTFPAPTSAAGLIRL